jgi:xylulokinase
VPALKAVSVTSTSGSLVVTDQDGAPLRPAILYDDGRPASVAPKLNSIAGGSAWNASHSLTKAVWVRETEPPVWSRVRHLLHPADWLSGKLSGQFGVSDHSNALKLGFLAESDAWSGDVERAGIPSDLLPRVLRTGDVTGHVTAAASAETGLPAGIPVVAGGTDGLTGLIASGAHKPGDANTTLGTTLVWKVLCQNRPRVGRGVYCHLHPSGMWAPGAASNTGPGSLQTEGSPEADREAAAWLPSGLFCYLLSGRGERFPFLDETAEAFRSAEPSCTAEWHAAQLQSLAFVERWGYETLAACGVGLGDRVYSAGAAAASEVFSQLRADVLGRVVVRCGHSNSAFGAAILAAAAACYGGDVCQALPAIASEAAVREPDAARHTRYDALYTQFREACAQRGWA